MNLKPTFWSGRNIALKAPSHLYDNTVKFYGEILGFELIQKYHPNVCFKFGDKQLWIDEVPTLSQAEIWLEIVTDDYKAASKYFDEQAIVRCDSIEELPTGHKGFWIMDPSSIVCHLVEQSVNP